jgi:hypothetical protein
MSVVGAASVVEAARQALGPVGVYLPVPLRSTPPVSAQRTAIARLESAGYLAAGADHVILMSSSSASNADLMTSVGQLEQLAPAALQSR